MAEVTERFWDNLLDYIEDGIVIPVIGPELVTVPDEAGGALSLSRWLARRLTKDRNAPADLDLNEAVSRHVRDGGEREDLYPQIHRLLRDPALTPCQGLRALTSIPRFDLFVSLTFDSLLADAIAAAGTGHGRPVEQIAYSPNALRDLAGPKAQLSGPVVFHLLGRASASPEYAICDEDLLEFLHVMQDKQRQPKTLFDELRGNHLLILGCDFSDWLARFFLRTARSLELSQKRRRWDVLVGDPNVRDAKLTQFLESFSPDARVIPMPAERFVVELAERWRAAHPAAASPAPAAPPAETDGRSLPTGALFVSYASDDLEAASRLADGLRAAGLDVWFDKNELQVGDDWARSIRRGIERCSLFLPVISRRALSEENRRRYFWREWNEAADFARGMAPDEAFIVPVVIDDTRIDRAPLPDPFKRSQGTSLPQGQVSPDVAKSLTELVREFHRRQRAG